MKKIMLILVALAFLVLGYVYFFMYNKSHPDYATINADLNASAETLYNDFTTSNDNQKYLGKVVGINGVISEIEKNDSITVVIFNFEEGMFGSQGVRCSMLNVESNKGLEKNISVEIKGLCTGYNETDVLLEYCSLIKK